MRFEHRTSVPFVLATALLLAGCAASPRHATFAATHVVSVTPPPEARSVRLWMALPREDAFQSVQALRVEAPAPHRITHDSEGNAFLFVEATTPIPPRFEVRTEFRVERREQVASVDPSLARPLTEAERAEHAHDLAPNQHVVIDDGIRALAREIVGDERNPIRAARAIYDWTLGHVDYWVKDPSRWKASSAGSSEYCLSTGTGNCTDFHSLWVAIARAAGIPSRILYGSFFKKELDGEDVDQSYHCWVEFLAPGIEWIPLDVAVADIFDGAFPLTKENEVLVRRTTADGYTAPDPRLVEYYFGSLDERRVLWNVGRDLVLDPRPAAGALSSVPKAWVEADGKALPEKTGWTRKLTYRQIR